ncbi:hypothetical protein RyT2_08190 [Pseudolactococcus yaeyamensis]
MTADEVTGMGFSLESEGSLTTTGAYPEVTQDNALWIHFQSQDGVADTDDETYFFNGPNDDGYGRSRVKSIIDAYYNHLGDKSAVQAVTLNTPNLTEFLSTANNGFNGTGSTYGDWNWSRTSSSPFYDDSYHHRDTRFETTVGSGKKQAFALSYGDIHGAIGVPTTPTTIHSALFDFITSPNTHFSNFWLRSPGAGSGDVGGVSRLNMLENNLKYYSAVHTNSPVRPSLYLSVD